MDTETGPRGGAGSGAAGTRCEHPPRECARGPRVRGQTLTCFAGMSVSISDQGLKCVRKSHCGSEGQSRELDALAVQYGRSARGPSRSISSRW